jgi:L-ascorbate metabolism protein UlaG (beta-lactamase superfamily)
MKIRLLRHAAMLLEYNGIKLLTDPMLDPGGARPPVECTPDPMDNPLVDLPVDEKTLNELISGIDGVLLSHTHFDHFDETAVRLLPKDIPVICQPADEQKLVKKGFTRLLPVEDGLTWKGIGICRTGGRHGSGLTGKLMGTVSGFVLKSGNEPALYITGDTVWCSCVEKALELHEPDVVVAYAGSAKFLFSSPITMTADDIYEICTKAPRTKVIAVHMEAVNHCVMKRGHLKDFLVKNQLQDRVIIPSDGETVNLV